MALALLRPFKKIPIFVVEEHSDALEFIYSAIGGRRLPLDGNTLLHLDAHPDMLIDRKLMGKDARSGRKVLPLVQIENWIVPATASGHISQIIWLRPPWAKQFSDGTRVIRVGDHPATGFLRVDSTEPYYVSDALYSSQLLNERKFMFTVQELHFDDKAPNKVVKLAKDLKLTHPYVLDIDLDFFCTGNPFLHLYENIGLYDRLLPIFDFDFNENDSSVNIDEVVNKREKQLQELESLFNHLEEHNNLDEYEGEKSDLYGKVSDLAKDVIEECKRTNESPDWWGVYAAGCTRDQDGLPFHINSEEEIKDVVTKALVPLLQNIPQPVMITIARSTEDGYCPAERVEFIQELVLHTLQDVYDTAEPTLHYLYNTN